MTQAQIDALEAERDEIKAEREGMQSDIDALKGEHAGLLERKYALDAQNELLPSGAGAAGRAARAVLPARGPEGAGGGGRHLGGDGAAGRL